MNRLTDTLTGLGFVLCLAACAGPQQPAPDPAATPAPPLSDTPVDSSDFDPYFIENDFITGTEGPSAITRNILEDRKGNIWLASFQGVFGYDGSVFTNYTNSEGLRRHRAFSLLEDRAGHIWIGTIGAGVYHYDGQAFTNITQADGLVHEDIGCIYEDREGMLWFGTRIGISRYDGKHFHNFTAENGLEHEDVNAILEDETGRFWIATRGEALHYDGRAFTSILRADGKPFLNVRTLLKDRNGNIWLGGNDGLWKWDKIGFTQFSSNFTGYIYEDKAGTIWTSSQSTNNRQRWVLSRYSAALQAQPALAPIEVLEREDMFFGILEDRHNGLWLGTLYGVLRYDGKQFQDF